ncbi:MAG: NepR family anti-sigma factor [Novosphingobium sp.]
MADSKRTGDTRKVKPRDTMTNPGQQMLDTRRSAPQPEWATGLKQLYNSVVEEPLPDSFAELIAKLDRNDS